MKLTNNEISLALSTINKIGQVELPIKTSYDILRVVKALEPQAKIVDEIRNKLVEKYGGEEKRVVPNTKEFAQFIEEFNPILQEEIEFRKLKGFKLPDDMKISLQDLALIEKLVIN